MFIQLRSCDPINLTYLFQISNKNLMLENYTNNKIHTTRLENMLVCRHSTGSLRNAQVSFFFFFFFLMLILKKKSFSYRYIILAMITLENKVNFLFFLLHHFLILRIVLTFLTRCPLRRFHLMASATAIRKTNDQENFQM